MSLSSDEQSWWPVAGHVLAFTFLKGHADPLGAVAEARVVNTGNEVASRLPIAQP